MPNESETISPWSLLITWMLANLLGWACGLILSALLTLLASSISWFNEDRGSISITLLSLGMFVGIVQWLVIKRYLSNAYRWIGATFLGYMLCLLIITLGNALHFGRVGLLDDVLLLGLFGIAVGISQWWILRKSFQQAWLWVLVNAIGFLVFLILVAYPAGSLAELLFFGTILGTVSAFFSGAALIWIVRQPSLSNSQAPSTE